MRMVNARSSSCARRPRLTPALRPARTREGAGSLIARRAGLTEPREDAAYGEAEDDEHSGPMKYVRSLKPAGQIAEELTKSSVDRSLLPAISNSALHEADRGGRTEVRRIR